MKNKIFLIGVFCLSLFFACTGQGAQESAASSDGKHFGKTIDAANATPLADMLAQMEQGKKVEMNAKVTGKVLEVCQKKGCWMTLDRGDGTDMRVTFKDYGFFMPKDISGRTVVIEGLAQVDTTSVDDLRHYAEDEGKSAEEIAKITEPETEISFVADGVILE